MKTVYPTKDEYIDNSVRVNYFEKNSLITKTVLELNVETGKIEKQTITETKDVFLYCERLIWDKKEKELDKIIEQHRLEWEAKINS